MTVPTSSAPDEETPVSTDHDARDEHGPGDVPDGASAHDDGQPAQQPEEDYDGAVAEPHAPEGEDTPDGAGDGSTGDAVGSTAEGSEDPVVPPADAATFGEQPTATEEPAAEEPAAEEPAAEEPAAEEPAGEEPAEEPAVELSGPPSQRLAQLGLELPPVPAPLAAYVPAVRTGDLVFTAGQLPLVDGALTKTGVVGDEAVDVTPQEAAVLARRCALNAIAAVASVVDIDSVRRVVKVVGFVASAPGFNAQPVVVNGASELLGQVFGDAGQHARSAVGVTALPLNAPVEVEIVVEVG